MPLIINSNGKVERLSLLAKMVRRISKIPVSLNTATGDALDRLASIYSIKRMVVSSPEGEFDEESDEALRTRLQCIRGN
jgi:phage-related baseplate assembly protein